MRNPASEAVGAARKGGEKLQPQLSGCSGGRRRGFNEDGTGGGSPPDTAFSRAFPCPAGDGPGDDSFPVTSLPDPRRGRADACRVGNMPVSWMVTEAPSLGTVHEPGERSFSDLQAGLSSTERWAEGVGAVTSCRGGRGCSDPKLTPSGYETWDQPSPTLRNFLQPSGYPRGRGRGPGAGDAV